MAKIFKNEKRTFFLLQKMKFKRLWRLFEFLAPVLVLSTIASMNNLEDKHYVFLIDFSFCFSELLYTDPLKLKMTLFCMSYFRKPSECVV